VLPGADLGMLEIGQNINFSLSQSEVGDYVIDIIDEARQQDVEESPPDHGHAHHHGETSS
jgi:uncharacterized FlaG/YvyC family protein